MTANNIIELSKTYLLTYGIKFSDAFVDESDYKDYDSKSAFLIKNKVVRKKMEFFMFYYQWLYY